MKSPRKPEPGHNRASEALHASDASEPLSLPSIRALHAADALQEAARRGAATLSAAAEAAILCGLGHNCVWNYARAVKAFQIKNNMRLPTGELRAAFNQWWQLAQPDLPTDAVADEYFEDFCDCYERVKHPLGSNVMDRARKQASSHVEPGDDERFGERTAKLVAVCRALASMTTDGVFFVSMRDAGKAMMTSDPYAPKKSLRRLIVDGVLEVVEAGTPGGRRATRYKFSSTTTPTP